MIEPETKTRRPAATRKSNFGRFLSVVLTGYAVLLLLQLWFMLLPVEVFVKVSVTVAVALVIAVLLFLIRRELNDEDELRKQNFLD